jgi:hypothetical protein
MKSEEQIREQLELFYKNYRDLDEFLPSSKHKLEELEKVEREIEALKWVLNEL